MKIELEVSEDNEHTANPWWVIIDPRQNFSTKDEYAIHNIASMVTGPYFSRQEAQDHLDARRYAFGDNAKVYCMSGCYARQYSSKVNLSNGKVLVKEHNKKEYET